MKSNLIGRRLCSMLCLVMSLMVLGGPARAFDLTSTDTSMTAPSGGTITVDGQPVTISAGQSITYAQYVALTQSLGGGQTLNIGSNGTATGGTFNVSSQTPLTSLVIPVGVTGVADFSSTGSLNLTGNLNNNGTLYVVSTNSAFSTATINANNVMNGGLLTSVLPTGGIAGYAGALTSLSLTINAMQNVINAGTISSAANLSVLAGNSIINALPTGAVGALPVMSAVNNLNLGALNVLNQGNITSALGNLNIETSSLINSGILQAVVGDIGIRNVLGSTMSIDNALGTISAGRQLLAEAIGNDAKALLDINGGVLSGANVLLRTNDGHLDVSVADINGILDISTGTARLAVSQGTGLNINSFNITGDPDLIYAGAGPFVSAGFNSLGGFVDINTTGTITFTGLIDTTSPVLNAAGGYVSLIGTTITTQGIITSGNGSGAAGAVTIAGTGNVTTGEITAPGATVNVSTTGGDIVLSAPGTWNLGSTNFTVNASGSSTIASAGGDLVLGTGTITNASAGLLQLQAFAGAVDLRPAIAAGTLAVNSTGAVVIEGNSVNLASAGTLNLLSNGNLGTPGFTTGTMLSGNAGGIQFVGGGGATTINFLGSGGEIRSGSYAGLNGTALTVNSAGDIYFRSTNFDNVGGSMALNVPTSSFYVAQFDTLGAGLQRYSNIAVNGGALGIYTDGTIQLNGAISTTNPGVPNGGGIMAMSGVTCVNCPNTQTGIYVTAGASVTADRGPIIFYVTGTDTTTPANPLRPLISIAAGATVNSVGNFVGGVAQGGNVALLVNTLPPGSIITTVANQRPTLVLSDMGTGSIQFMPGAVQVGAQSLSATFPSGTGTITANGNGLVQINDNGLNSLIAGSGSVYANGGYVFVGGNSYAGEITIDGAVTGSVPFVQTAPPVVVVPVPEPPAPPVPVVVLPPVVERDPPAPALTPSSAQAFDVTRNPTATAEPAAAAVQSSQSQQQSAPTTLPAGSGTIIAVACQRFVLERNEDDNSFVVAGGGTRFSRVASKDKSSPDQLSLEEGKLMTLAGGNGVSMSTKQGVISLPAGASAMIEKNSRGGLAISSVNGGGTSVTIGGQTIAVNDGEQIVIGDSDEELIPTDYSAEVTATITVASKIVQTRKFDRHKMVEREKLLLCASGADTRDLNRKLKKKLDQVIQHMNKVADQGAPGDNSQSKLPPVSSTRFRGVAYITPVKTLPAAGMLNTVATATAHVRDMGNSVYTEGTDGSLTMENGDLLIQPNRKTTVNVGQASVVVEPNSMVLITKDGGTIKIANVWERQSASARIHIGDRFIPLSAGREAIITSSARDSSRAMKDADVARRRVKESKCGSLVVTTADVSIHSLLRSDRVLNTLVHSTKSDDKAACDRIIKMAAVLTMATSGRGKYETAAGN